MQSDPKDSTRVVNQPLVEQGDLPRPATSPFAPVCCCHEHGGCSHYCLQCPTHGQQPPQATSPFARADEFYLAMAALDNYPVVDDLPKSTSVVFRIHQLGHKLAALEQRVIALTLDNKTLQQALSVYGRHKCALRVQRWEARAYHFENHDGDLDWDTGVVTCGDSDCEAWVKAGADGEPDCTCGFLAALDATKTP